MKALILTDLGASATNQNPGAGDANSKVIANALWACDIPSQFIACVNADQPRVVDINQMVDDGVIDMVFIGRYVGVAGPSYSRFIDGSINCPVFVMGVASFGTEVKGTLANPADASDTWSINNIAATSNTMVVVGRRHLERNVIAPEEVTTLVTGVYDGDGTAGTPLFMWQYTPDNTATTSNKGGPNYVFQAAALSNQTYPVHLMLQKAFLAGCISAAPRAAPFIINMDHCNDAGEPAAAGGIGGWQENPAPLLPLAQVFRDWNSAAVYGSIEQVWEDGEEGTTTGALAANLVAASDVIKYSALHNHSYRHLSQITGGAAAGNPFNNQQTKTFIDLHYNETRQSITNIGLTVDNTFGHFANNAVSSNLWDLATTDTTIAADPLETTPKAGYGMRMGRLGSITESWPTNILFPSTSVIAAHWLSESMCQRSIELVQSSDAGATSNNTSATTTITTGTNPQFTTGTAHGAIVGALVYLAGMTTTPDITGWWTIDTIVDAENFTIDMTAAQITVVTSPVGTTTNFAKSVNAITARMMQGMNSGLATYLHAEDYEDVPWRFANLGTTPSTTSGGVLNLSFGIEASGFMGSYCDACGDFAQFGADVLNYLAILATGSPTLTMPYPDVLFISGDSVNLNLNPNISGDTSLLVEYEPAINSGLSESAGIISGTVTTPTSTALVTVTGSNSFGKVVDSFQLTTLTTGDPSTGINVPINS